MRVLVLGGSWFVGAAVVDRARERGHVVTVFNRGRTPAVFSAGVRVIHGDRENLEDLRALARHGPWDAVIDVAGSVPAVVRDSARALAGHADRYVFISTVSAYRQWPRCAVSEASEVHPGDPDLDPGHRRWDAVAYGPLKAGCEAAIAREYAPSQRLILRPGVVLGPGEYVGRVPWWLARMRRGGRILAPGGPARSIQPVDVRDLADFVVSLTAGSAAGVFNVAAPQGVETYGGLLQACADAVDARPQITWVDGSWLADQGVRQWTEIPLWRTAPGTWAMDASLARSRGLVCRPLTSTVADVHAWLSDGGAPVEHERWAEHGLSPDREASLLAAWDAEQRPTAPR